jgi:hypothetical protein
LYAPAEMDVNVPAGAVAWSQVFPHSSLFEPQQETVPSDFSPHVWRLPAATAANVPAGGVAWSILLDPQQLMVRSVLTPQEWY